MEHWRSQNISESEFVLVRNKPITKNNVDPIVNDYAQELFDRARGPYVAFGVKENAQSMLFRVNRTGQSTLLTLVPGMSDVPENKDDRDRLFEFIFRNLNDLGPKRSMRVRLVRKPFIDSNNLTAFLIEAERVGWNLVAVDGHRRRQHVSDVLRQINQNLFKIEDNIVVSRSDSELPHDIPRVHKPDIEYWIAKRRLENFMLQHNIQENIQSEEWKHVDNLLPLYTSWFRAMVVYFRELMPTTLLRALQGQIEIDERINLMTEHSHEWVDFFMTLDTKYPLLLAAAYIWRIRHWFFLQS